MYNDDIQVFYEVTLGMYNDDIQIFLLASKQSHMSGIMSTINVLIMAFL